ncbi:MAG: hypothetical protein RI904_2038, partial [Pseudomonadota bacterium]
MNKQPTCIALKSTSAERHLRKVHLLTILVIA